MKNKLPIKNVCMECEPNKKFQEGYRLSHWYCKIHSEAVKKRFQQELMEMLEEEKKA